MTGKPQFPFPFAVLLMLLAGAVPAAEPVTQGAEIEALKQQVRDLQARVEKLEAGMDQAEAAAIAVGAVEPIPGGWHEAHNWRLLTKGMETSRVEQILGEPEGMRTIKKFEFWEYGDSLVRFYLGRLKSWDLPEAFAQ